MDIPKPYLWLGLAGILIYLSNQAQGNSAVVSPDGTDPVSDALAGIGGLYSLNATTFSQDAIDTVAASEGDVLTAYQDVAGIWTIGVGHATAYPGETETEAQSQADEIGDLTKAANVVNNAVSVPLTQGMFDALTCFIFNCGGGAFLASTMLRLLNSGDYQGAYDQFPRWVYAKENGVETVVGALVRRRQAEQALFIKEGLSPDGSAA